MDLSTSLLKNLTTIQGMKSNKNVAGKASNDVIIDYASGDKIMNQCLQPLIDILKKEHCKDKNLPFTDEIALNLDDVEKLKKTGVNGSKMMNTVDMVIGLYKNRLLMVEIKLDCKSVKDIPKDICDKISHSRDLLIENPKFVTFEKKIPVLIKNDNFEQNKRRLKNYLMGKNKDIEPYTVNGFYSTFF